VDTFAPKERSEIMRRVPSQGTRPELIIRRILRRMRIKYRSCSQNLPGKPDLVIHWQRKAILVQSALRYGRARQAGV
jgi:DNA mismatch endonuclease (patch repair protein)